MITDSQITVAPTALPDHLRARVPEVDGEWLVTDGEPPAGCLVGRLDSGELVYLTGWAGETDDDGCEIYTGWAVVSDRLPEIDGAAEA